jgi:hypothetical protein
MKKNYLAKAVAVIAIMGLLVAVIAPLVLVLGAQ